MKKWLVILLVLSGTLVLAQQSDRRNIGSFKGVKAAEGIDVYLKKGDKESVTVEASGIAIEKVITELSGDYLKIHVDEGRYSRSRTIKVYVTYVDISKLSASSAANIYCEGIIKTKSLALSSSSAGTIDIGIDVETLTVNASSAADVELKGKAKYVDIDVSSAAEVDAYDLEAEEATASASSGGSIKISVKQKIEARASSGGSVRYRGNPIKTDTNSSSGGSVKKSS